MVSGSNLKQSDRGHLSNEKGPLVVWGINIGDYTIQFYGDYNKP